jgi:hypothetical protein
MSRYAAWGVVLALLFCAVAADNAGEPPKEIPLNTIWALQMPGTRDVRDLEGKLNVKELSADALVRSSKVLRIRQLLAKRRPDGEIAGSAFVVEGTGKDALAKAAGVFAQESQTVDKFPTQTELTLVFFSHLCGQYLWIDSVDRTNDRITIKYRFVSHHTRDATAHFALIPLGQLAAGTYRVEMQQLPNDKVNPSKGFRWIGVPEEIVSGPFEFRVEK